LDDFASVSRGISRGGPQNLAKFPRKTVDPSHEALTHVKWGTGTTPHILHIWCIDSCVSHAARTSHCTQSAV